MTNGEFAIVFESLERAFKQKELPQEKISRYWEKCKDLEYEGLKRLIDFMIDNNKFFPTPNEIAVAVQHLGLKHEKSKINGPENCKFCFGTGMPCAVKDDNDYAFKCTCEWGKQYSDEHFKKWNPRYEKLGYKLVYQG